MITETFKKACRKAARHTDRNEVAEALKALAKGLETNNGLGYSIRLERNLREHLKAGHLTPEVKANRDKLQALVFAEIEKVFGAEGVALANKSL